MQGSLKTVFRGLVFFGLVWLVAIIGYRVAGWNLLDSVYMTTITIFGVGFGEIGEMTPGLRVFTMFVIVAGCSSTAYVIGGFVQMLAEGHVNRVLGARRMTRGIHLLADHTLLCGYGRVGKQLAKELREYGQKFVIVDSNLEALREAESEGYLVLVGDCIEESVLLQAGILRARAVASVLSDDAQNVFLTLTARELNPNVLIVARAENRSTEKKLLHSGANRIVLPTTIGATKIANLIVRRPGEDLLSDPAGRELLNTEFASLGVRLWEQPVDAQSRLAGASPARIERENNEGYLIVGIRRAGTTLFGFNADARLETGDTLLVLSHPPDGAGPRFRVKQSSGAVHRGYAK